MGRLRRNYIPNQVYMVGNRVAKGLPFVPSEPMNKIILGILARANHLYPSIDICSWLFMGNHYHAIVVTRDSPHQLASFMGYIDGELARFINRFRGITNESVWAGRYDAQLLLDQEIVIEKLAYIFTNPQRARLVKTIEEYPGISTWSELQENESSEEHLWVRSANARRLPPRGQLRMRQVKSMQQVLSKATDQHSLTIKPFAWLDCFDETIRLSESEARTEIHQRVADEERSLQRNSLRSGLQYVGHRKLAQQCFFQRFFPKQYTRRKYCSSSVAGLAAECLAAYREFCAECTRCWQALNFENNFVIFPEGAFIPSTPMYLASG